MIITDYCTGCRLCELLCPKSAIEMRTDSEGFLTSYIKEDSCINCQLCLKRCPQNAPISKYKVGKAYAIRLKDENLLKGSASGGAFVGFANNVIIKNGVVVGVVYDEKWNAYFTTATNIEELKPMQSSKYLQADTKDIFSLVKRRLQDGLIVLFSGTACQVAGLRKFLNREYDNLITVDIICHGVTSPLMFKDYIHWLEDKSNSKMEYYNFRSKDLGWGLNFSYKMGKKKVTRPSYLDPYYQPFLGGDAYRECCYRCNYSSLERISDLTIGDYWGIQEEHPSFYSDKGVSAVLINTEKGRTFFENNADAFYYIETTPLKIAKRNENLLKPTTRNGNRDHFYDNILTDGQWFDKIAQKYRPSTISILKASLPVWLRVIIKKILKK